MARVSSLSLINLLLDDQILTDIYRYAWITAEYGDCSLHSGLASDPVEPRIWQDTKEWEGRTDYAAGTGGM